MGKWHYVPLVQLLQYRVVHVDVATNETMTLHYTLHYITFTGPCDSLKCLFLLWRMLWSGSYLSQYNPIALRHKIHCDNSHCIVSLDEGVCLSHVQPPILKLKEHVAYLWEIKKNGCKTSSEQTTLYLCEFASFAGPDVHLLQHKQTVAELITSYTAHCTKIRNDFFFFLYVLL